MGKLYGVSGQRRIEALSLPTAVGGGSSGGNWPPLNHLEHRKIRKVLVRRCTASESCLGGKEGPLSVLVGGGVAAAELSDLVWSGFGRESLSFLYFLASYILTMIHGLTMIHIIASIVDQYSFGHLRYGKPIFCSLERL